LSDRSRRPSRAARRTFFKARSQEFLEQGKKAPIHFENEEIETMTKGARQAAGKGAFPALDYERMMALSSANLEAMMQASEAVLKGLAKLNGELVGFASARIKEQLEGGRSLAECGNWSDALEKQASLMQNASAQYFAEARKLSSLASELALASWTPLQNCLKANLPGSARQVPKS